jgi:hypothetical protein
MPCSRLNAYRRFGVTCRLCLQGRSISQERKRHKSGCKLRSDPSKRLLTFNRLHDFIPQNIYYICVHIFLILIYFPKFRSCRCSDFPLPLIARACVLCPVPDPESNRRLLLWSPNISVRFRFVIFSFLWTLLLSLIISSLSITVCSFDIFQQSDFVKAEHHKI